MAEVHKLPIGIQSFEDLRRNQYLYVDKTQYIWELVNTGKSYFLSRPRRFGKSLLITTIEAYFQGQKELFDGLYIDRMESKKEQPWVKHAVIHFSLSGGEYLEKDGLWQRLSRTIATFETKYNIHTDGMDLVNRFGEVIEQLYQQTGQQVVVLVDEYDKPLLSAMEANPVQEEKNRQLYKDFFSVLKDEDRYLKFVFFTGVTKFSKVSIFSDLNQLQDISMREDMSGICGITADELERSFETEIARLAGKQKENRTECLEHIRKMYDGYHFAADGEDIYNPFSLLNAFQSLQYGKYWFETGTPTFLIRKLRESTIAPEELIHGVSATEDELRTYRAEDRNPIPLLYQSGYLTLQSYDREFGIYTLTFPNEEVEYGFLNALVPTLLGERDHEHPFSMRELIMELRKGDAAGFLDDVKALFATIPYLDGRAAEYESYWRNQIFLILQLMGMYTRCEVHTATGRCDCVVETTEYIYILEFKLDHSAEDALRQIEEKQYAAPCISDPRKIYRIGVQFSSKKRNIEDFQIETD